MTEGREVAVTQPNAGAVAQWESPDSLNKRINRMLAIQRDVMKAGVDYDTIPGTQKPSLMKPGAELLGATFNIADDMAPMYPERIEEEGGHIRYIVKLDFRDRATGIFLGHGIGECSTSEEKYAWRRAVCEEEFEDTDESKRRIKYSKYQGKVQKTQQIRTNPSDVANTVLKMAKKRAKVDGILNVLAASRIFSQDLEDLPEGMDLERNTPTSKKPDVEMPKAKSEPQQQTRRQRGGYPITEKQAKRVFYLCKKHGAAAEDVKFYLKVKHNCTIDEMTKGEMYDSVCTTIEKQPDWFRIYREKCEAASDASDAGAPSVADQIRELAGHAGIDNDEALNNVLHTEFSVELDMVNECSEQQLDEVRAYFAERVNG